MSRLNSGLSAPYASLGDLVNNMHPSACHLITDTVNHAITGKVIVAGSAGAVIATLTGTGIQLNGANVATLSSYTMAAGEALYGEFTAIDLASGSVIVY
jgi:hypothetical protein